jgi:hypothetical protein
MKADEDGPVGVPARILGESRPGEFAALVFPGVEEHGGGIQADGIAADLLPADCRAEGAHVLLTQAPGDAPQGYGPFVSAIALPRYELWLRVPGPFPDRHGDAFVRWVVGPLETELCQLGLTDYVHPWTFPTPDQDEWDCCYSVNDLRRALEATRRVLGGLGLPPETVIEVNGSDDERCRTYPISPRSDAEDWFDFTTVEAHALLPLDVAVHQQTPCW